MLQHEMKENWVQFKQHLVIGYEMWIHLYNQDQVTSQAMENMSSTVPKKTHSSSNCQITIYSEAEDVVTIDYMLDRHLLGG